MISVIKYFLLGTVIIMLSCTTSHNFNCVEAIATSISAVIACLSFILALITIIMAADEYKKKQKYEKCEVLMKYNERFENSEAIQKITSYYANLSKKENSSTEMSSSKKISINDKELFLRFFEELNYMLDVGYLDKDVVADTFSFYFIVAWDDDKWFWANGMRNDEESIQSIKKSVEWRNAYAFYKKFNKTEIANKAKKYLETFNKESR